MRYKIKVGSVVLTSVVCATIILAGFVFMWAQSFTSTASPEIYLHTEEEITIDLTIRIEDGVTKTIPEVEMGREATWNDLTVHPDGMIEYEGNRYPFLYYEGVFIERYPETDKGWVISEVEGGYLVNGELHSSGSIQGVMMDLFMGSGLTPNESSIMLLRARSLGVLEGEGDIVLRYIPEEEVNDIIEISSSIPTEMMRRHFLVEVTDDPPILRDPLFEDVPEGPFVIHETALNWEP